MSQHQYLWVIASTISGYFLFELMRRRQAQLADLLNEYIRARAEWAQKRKKAIKMARLQAKAKEAQQQRMAELAESDDEGSMIPDITNMTREEMLQNEEVVKELAKMAAELPSGGSRRN